MEIYNKNTKISITIRGSGEEIFEFNLPHPHHYSRNGEQYTLEYIIRGYFSTNLSSRYLNDILARLMLSVAVIHIERTITKEKGIRLKNFSDLKSIPKFKHKETVDIGLDNVFWAIKMHAEHLIREYGQVPYSLIESFAFDNFIDRTKDKSTLRAKCRSIWNWYDARGWTIPSRKGLGMSRAEGAKNSAQKNAMKTKEKVIKAIVGLEFMQEKLTITAVARDAKVSRNTAKKYLEKWKTGSMKQN